jgi:methylated-DNA-[protein]-cysteine S-methyltransferase
MKMAGDYRTGFQEKVYQLVRMVPRGKVSTYREIAGSLGKGKLACRAVGQALNRSPGMPAVPCHRVIRSDGHLGGFAWGIDKKASLLAEEGIEIKNNHVQLDKYLFDLKQE